MFSVTGRLKNRRASVRWTGPGQVEGDLAAIARVRSAITRHSELEMPPTADVFTATLEVDWLALATIRQFGFDGSIEVSGDVPDPPWEKSPPDRVY